MTYDDRRPDPVEPPVDPVDPVDNETRVVEQQTYVEPEQPVAEPYPVPAAAPAPVNVNAPTSRGYEEPPGPSALYYMRRILSLLFGILATLLGLRIVLLLLVANEQNNIVDFVYDVTEPFVAPFRGMFAIDTVTPGGGSVFDVAALVALIGWMLIYLLLMAILRLVDRDRVRSC